MDSPSYEVRSHPERSRLSACCANLELRFAAEKNPYRCFTKQEECVVFAGQHTACSLTQNPTEAVPFWNVTLSPRAIAARASSISPAFVLPTRGRKESNDRRVKTTVVRSGRE